MHAALGAQPAVRPTPVDRHGHALQAGLLTFLFVDDLGLPAVALGPAEVHPEEHRRPVGRLGAPGTGADAQDRRSLVVLTGEQELGALAKEIAFEVLDRAVDLVLQLGIARLLGELQRRLEVVRSGKEARPELDLGPEAVGLAQDALRATGVVPEARLGSALVECGQPFLFAGKVKDAPRSTGSAPPGPGRVRRPPKS